MYKIIIDSCGELSEEMKEDGHFCTVPLTLQIDDTEIIDDATFEQADFLARVQSRLVLLRTLICRLWREKQIIFM